MKIREKLLDFKRRLQDRKMYSIMVFVIAAIALLGFYQYKQASNYRQKLDNQYNRSFYDLVGFVDNVQTLLLKSLITSSTQKTATTLQEVSRQAMMAQTNLGQIPVSHNIIANTSKFLTQVGDLSSVLNSQNVWGKPVNDEQYNSLKSLYGYALELGKNLNDIQGKLSTGRMKWGELEKISPETLKKASQEMPSKQFENIDKAFQNYPSLIYDGPFSDHITNVKPKGLSGEKISQNEASERAKVFLGKDKVKKITFRFKNESELVNTYIFDAELGTSKNTYNASIEITEQGGLIYAMLANRAVDSAKISMEKAKEAGLAYLKECGIDNMVDTYFLLEDNTAIVNYAYKKNDITIYPELIKVKVALDNGEILGIESKGYLYSHTSRDIPKPKLSLEEAKALVNKRLEIQSSGIAIIPTIAKTELLTYEFKGKFEDKEFLVYINAETGKEENLLIIINTPNGTLTM